MLLLFFGCNKDGGRRAGHVVAEAASWSSLARRSIPPLSQAEMSGKYPFRAKPASNTAHSVVFVVSMAGVYEVTTNNTCFRQTGKPQNARHKP